MERGQKQLILTWLKQGFFEWDKLHLLKPKKSKAEEEKDFLFLCSLIHTEYCQLMKVRGLCPLFEGTPDMKYILVSFSKRMEREKGNETDTD